MSNKKNRHKTHQNDRGDYTLAPEIITVLADSGRSIHVYPTEYRALIESDTRIKVIKDLAARERYISAETLVAVAGARLKGEIGDA